MISTLVPSLELSELDIDQAGIFICMGDSANQASIRHRVHAGARKARSA